ncbi:MAG TPA: molybdopterin molybdotransferase MoeA [Stenotrophobium sp.]|nr:molybdopterin molybdotransferase MoeA [Stenotrophobium sp.]
MIPLAEALATYPAQLRPLPAERIPLQQALYRVLRADVLAACDLPRHSQSALDGYVLTAADAARAPCRLRIAGTLAAGDTAALTPLVDGECRRIYTGARVPPNAGAVVAQERVSIADGHIGLRESLKPGANIRMQGEEMRAGSPVARSGQRLTPGLIAALAAAGAAQVQVTRAPRIRLLVSGDELRPLGTSLADGQIWDSNGPLVLSWLAAHGYAAQAQHLPDERVDVERMLDAALTQCDLVITTGGVSVGDRDYIIPSAEKLGVRRVFWRVAQKPGKPLYFGLREGAAILGLPGNPAAVLIGLVLHVSAALDVLAGADSVGASFHPGTLAAPVRGAAQRDSLLRMRLEYAADGRAMLHPLPHQDSHMLSNLNRADVLAHVPAQDRIHAAGEILGWTLLA